MELEHDLILRARERLADFNAEANVYQVDMYSADLNEYKPDVVFAFLTSSSLQALSSSLLRLPSGTRVVAVGTPIPGWIANKTHGSVFLYHIPPEFETNQCEPSWGCPGIAVILPALRHMVTSFLAIHPAGPAAIRSSPELTDVLDVCTGAERLSATGPLAIDLYWHPSAAGTIALGSLESAALGRLPVLAIYSDVEPFGCISFSFE